LDTLAEMHVVLPENYPLLLVDINRVGRQTLLKIHSKKFHRNSFRGSYTQTKGLESAWRILFM